MKSLVVIPVFNFWGLVPKLISFYSRHHKEAEILIINDGTVNKSINVKMWKNAQVYMSRYSCNLKGALQTAYEINNEQYGCDTFIINEHDVIPNAHALQASLFIHNDPPINNHASVSAIYKWDGKMCYPSHPNWFKDQPQMNYLQTGRIAIVGKQGIPFGFSIWKSGYFKNIIDKRFPNVWKLDHKFGEYVVVDCGASHIRLLDYHVEHFNKGVNSWKK